MTNPEATQDVPRDLQSRSAAARLDALLIAQAHWHGDHTAERIVTKHANPIAVNGVLADWLRTAVRKAIEYGAGHEYDDCDEFDVIARWISGEPQ